VVVMVVVVLWGGKYWAEKASSGSALTRSIRLFSSLRWAVLLLLGRLLGAAGLLVVVSSADGDDMLFWSSIVCVWETAGTYSIFAMDYVVICE
jgi:hypothetical protein